MAHSGLPPLSWLRAFEAAARHLSFTQAAAELNLTQSAVSQHVRSLEARLGRNLFIRRTRALALTEAGSNYLPIVQEAFGILTVGTRAFTGGDRDRLVVKCNLAFSVFWLSPRLPEFYDLCPDVTLNIITPIWDPEVHTSNVDVEIRFGRAANVPTTARKLGNEYAFPACAADLANANRDWRTARLFDCAGVLTNWQMWVESKGEEFPASKSVSMASTYVVSMHAAMAGTGLCMTHTTLAEECLRTSRLVASDTHKVAMQEAYYLVPTPTYSETKAARQFYDWVGDSMTRNVEGAT